ncbi:MAG: hypothetical protein ACXADL_05305 [Candidatus Thorarchaeota archaeon]|jgi:hypothetical protein
MIEKYNEYMSQSFQELPVNEDGEAIMVLSETEWVRVLLIRNNESPDICSIEVESSLPVRAVLERADNYPPGTAIKDAIIHLQYIRDLQDFGFKLDLVGEESLWTAVQTFSGPPPRTLFERLVPPSTWTSE